MEGGGWTGFSGCCGDVRPRGRDSWLHFLSGLESGRVEDG